MARNLLLPLLFLEFGFSSLSASGCCGKTCEQRQDEAAAITSAEMSDQRLIRDSIFLCPCYHCVCVIAKTLGLSPQASTCNKTFLFLRIPCWCAHLFLFLRLFTTERTADCVTSPPSTLPSASPHLSPQPTELRCEVPTQQRTHHTRRRHLSLPPQHLARRRDATAMAPASSNHAWSRIRITWCEKKKGGDVSSAMTEGSVLPSLLLKALLAREDVQLCQVSSPNCSELMPVWLLNSVLTLLHFTYRHPNLYGPIFLYLLLRLEGESVFVLHNMHCCKTQKHARRRRDTTRTRRSFPAQH